MSISILTINVKLIAKRGVFLDNETGGAVLYYHYGGFHILCAVGTVGTHFFFRILIGFQWTLRSDMAMAKRGSVGISLVGVLGGLWFRLLFVRGLVG